MYNKRIPVSGPSITSKEIEYVTEAVSNAWYENANIFNIKFEKKFSEYTNTKYAISLPSCTSAIHLALLALGVGPQDEVIVPDVTWIASAAPIRYVGATPVFADIDSNNWCMSASSLERYITNKTKAIIVVDLYGNMPEWDEIKKIASHYDIPIIEDAAEALGSEYKGEKAGSLGDVGVFSFHGSKTLTTGEGGMLVTGNEDLYSRCLFLRDHGRKPSDKMFWNTEIGFKYKMSSLQAALGLAQLERVKELVTKKRQIFDWYFTNLSNVEGITLNPSSSNVKNSYWMSTIVIDKKMGLTKEKVISELAKFNVDSRPFFYPLSQLPAFSELESIKTYKKENINSYLISPYGINLPSGLSITNEEVDYVCEKLVSVLGGCAQ